MESKSIDEIMANKPKDLKKLSREEAIELNIKRFNESKGSKSIYECPICKNKGYIAVRSYEDFDGMKYVNCKCRKIRNNYTKMNYLGLLDNIKKIPTIEAIPENTLGKYMKIRLKEYLADREKNDLWLCLLGQPGSGKTTYASLIILNMIEKNPDIDVEFINWDTQWEDLTYKNPKASELMDELKECDVLYIDDFLRHKELIITDLERRCAKEIIDYRYRMNKTTIITSERMYEQLRTMDQAIASRIFEKATNKYVVNIKSNPNYNFREQKVEEI